MPREFTRRLRAWARRVFGPVKPIEPPIRSLVICPLCDNDHVVPLAYEEVGEAGWWMHLRCGDCGARRDVRVSDAEANRFGLALGAGTREIADDLERLLSEPVKVFDFDRLTPTYGRGHRGALRPRSRAGRSSDPVPAI